MDVIWLEVCKCFQRFYGELAINNFSVPLLPFCTGITNPLEYGTRIGKVKIIG